MMTWHILGFKTPDVLQELEGAWFVEEELSGASRLGKGKAWAFHPLPCVLLQLDALVRQKQGGILLHCLRDVSLPTAAWRKAAVLGPVAGPAAVVGVILGRLALVSGAAVSACLSPGPDLLLAAAWSPATLLGAG